MTIIITKNIHMALKDYSTKSNKELVNKLAELTGSHPNSVYRWLRGEVKPFRKNQEIIAKYLNKDINTLFPSTNDND